MFPGVSVAGAAQQNVMCHKGEMEMNDSDKKTNASAANGSPKNKSHISKRFFISLGWAMALLTFNTIINQPKNQWAVGLYGSAVFALLAGVIAMAVPSNRMTIYISVSLLVMYVVALIVGSLVT